MCTPAPKITTVAPQPLPAAPPPPPPPAPTVQDTLKATPTVTTATALKSRRNPLAIDRNPSGDSVSTGLNIPM